MDYENRLHSEPHCDRAATFEVLKKRYFFVTHLNDKAQISGIPDGIFIVLTIRLVPYVLSYFLFFFLSERENTIRYRYLLLVAYM